MIYCHSEKSFTTEEVLDILHHPEWTRVIREPPIKPRAGTAFLYHYEDEKKKDDWRCDLYHFQNDGIRKQPRSNPQFNKSFFVIRNAEGKKDGRFKKQAYKLLQEHKNLVLIQYVGDESIAVDLPHGNSNDSSTVYTRVCPSTLANIKETSASPSEVLQQLEHLAQETKAPELHKPRSLLHIKNTRCRANRKANPVGKKKRKRKKRFTVGELKVALQVINNKTEDTSAKVCSSNKGKDSEIEESIPITPDVKSPNTEFANLCENIYLENAGNQATYVPNLGDEDNEQGMSFVEELSLTELTTIAQNDIEHHQNTNSIQLQYLQIEDHQMTAQHQTDIGAEGNNECNSSDKGNNETVIQTAQACSSLPHSLPQSLSSSNAINQDSNHVTQYGEISYIASNAREEGIYTINECITNPQPQCLMTEMDASSSPVTHNLPMRGCHTATSSFENFLRDIITNGDLKQVSCSLRHILESQGHTKAVCLSELTAASSTAAVLTSADMLVDSNLTPITSSIQTVRSPHGSTYDEISGHQTISSLISQVSTIWNAELDIAKNIIHQSTVLEETKQPFLQLLAALTVGAFKTCTNVKTFVETIKACPSHIELSRAITNTTSIDVDGNYRIGKYTLYGKDIQQLEGDNWLDDSVIHAYLHLLQNHYTTEKMGQVLIWECFLYTKWENHNHNEWLYKEVSLLKYDWILLPICRSHHWVLLAANVRMRTVMVINSKPSPAAEADILNHWRKFMQQRSVSTGEVLTDWRKVECPVFPQTDGSSCGVYVLMTAEALIADVPAAILRSCHVTMYREYAKRRLLTAAEVSHCQQLERVRIDGDELMELQTDEKGESMVELKDTFQETPDSSIIEYQTLGKEHRMENGIENDCMKTPNGISDLLQKVLFVSSLHEECDENIADLAFFQDMFENHKMTFAVVTFICLENGSFELTKTNPQIEEDTMNTNARWSCILSGLDPIMGKHLQDLLCNIRDQIPDNFSIRFKQRDSMKVISSILSSNAAYFIADIDLEFLHKYVVLQCRNGEHDNGFLIRLRKANYVNLAKRFSEAIAKYSFAFVLTHEACSKHCFNELLINCLKLLIETNAFEEICMQSDKIFGGSFLNWTCFGKTADLYKLCSVLMHLSKEEAVVACCISGNSHIVKEVLEVMELQDLLSLRAKAKIPGLNLNQKVEVFETHRLPLLHLACYYGHVPIIKCLLELGFDVNAQLNNDFEESDQTPMGSTPMCLAAERGHANTIQFLIEYGGDPKIVDCDYNSPLHLSCREGHAEAVGLLINKSKFFERNMQGNTPLHLACVKCSHDIVCTLLRMQVDITVPNFDDNTPLDIACINGSVNIAKQLLEACPKYIPCDGSNTPLHKACNGGFADIVNLLLRHKAENAVNMNDKNPLTLALEKNYQHVVRVLLEITNNKFVLPSSHLAIAIRNKQLSITQLLIEKSTDVSAPDPRGYTPLYCACITGQIEIIKLLTEKGADVSAAGSDGDTPLNCACRTDDIEIVKLLIEKGADVSAAGSDGDTPLYWACENDEIEIVKLLIEKGADVSAAFSNGNTPLYGACRNGQIEIVKLLIEKGADVSAAGSDGDTPLNCACRIDDIEIVKLLIEKGADVSAAGRLGYTPLYWACMNGQIEIVKLLIEKGADVSAAFSNGDTPLYGACRNGQIEIVKLLIEKGADVSAAGSDGDTPLNCACMNGQIEIVKLLIEKGADVSAAFSNGDTPLYGACRNGQIEIVKLLIEKGADVSAAGSDGDIPLNWACRNGQIEIVKLLIEKGADVSAAFSNGDTPLYGACRNGQIEIVKLLIEKGADVSAAGSDGDTPLNWACRIDDIEIVDIEIVKLLIEKGADVSAAGRLGYTPLYWACENDEIEIVKLLIEKGADVSAAFSNGDTPLYGACRNGQIEIVKLLIEKGADVSAAGSDGDTPLYWACENDDIEIVKLLIEKGADVSAAGRLGYTPLNWACENDDIEIVKLLIEKGADVSAAGRLGYTPLNWACMNGQIEIVKLLIEKGADVSAAGRLGYTPLNWACMNGQIEIVKLLIEKGADVSAAGSDGDTPLNWACMNGQIEIVKLLIEKGADVSAAGRLGYTPLNWACENDDIEIVKLLIEKGADVSAAGSDGDTPLNWACRNGRNGQIEIVKLLIEKGADVSAAGRRGYTPLNLACINGQIEIVKLLIEKGADVSAAGSDGGTPLNRACENDDIEIVKLLIEKGADVSAAGSDGGTPLNCACRNGQIEIFKLLIEKGADVSAAGSDGDTPLNWACRNGQIEIVKLLIEKGADVSAAGSDGDTPLNWACRNGQIEIVKLLIEKGADVSAAGSDGDTPLNWACRNGQIEIVKLLIEKGADVSAAGRRGYTPLNLACINGQIEIVKLLIEKGADVSAAGSDGYTPLNLACINGQIEIVKLLIEKGADVSAAGSDGGTPLNRACENDDIEIVKLLIEKGADVSAAGSDGDTPLNWACRKGQIEIVKLLIEKGADVSAAGSDGDTPLNWACRNGQIEIVKLLIEKGADVSAAGSDGDTPLNWACRNGQIEIVKLLIEKGADVSAAGPRGYTPLYGVSRNGQIDEGADLSTINSLGNNLNVSNVTKVFTPKGNDISDHKHKVELKLLRGIIKIPHNLPKNLHHFLLCLAVNYGDAQALILLTDNFKITSKVHEYYINVLLDALKQRHIAIFRILYTMGDIEVAHNILLFEACTLGLVSICNDISERCSYIDGRCLIAALKVQNSNLTKLLMEKGVDLFSCDDEGNSSLHLACALGDSGIVDKLVTGCVSTSGTNERLETPLHVACKSGHLEIVQRLLYKFLDLTMGDEHGNTVLHVACNRNDTEIVQCILRYGYHRQRCIPAVGMPITTSFMQHLLSIENIQKETPLHVACERGNLDIVRGLLSAGADVTHINQHGKTILHTACKNRNRLLFKCLLDHCHLLPSTKTALNMTSLLNVADTNGESALHVACRKNCSEIVQLMLTYDFNILISDKNRNIALHIACNMNNLNIVKSLLTAGANVTQADNNGKTILHTACEKGNMLLLQCILDYCHHHVSGGIVLNMTSLLNMVDTNGESALHIACRKNCIEIVKRLLACGVNIFLSDKNGNTPAAYLEKNCDLFQLSCKYVHTISAVNQEGNSLLHLACQKGRVECVRTLLEKGAHTSIFNKHGDYPVHKAAENDNVEVVHLLLTCKANINVLNRENQTPLHIACAEGNTLVAGILIQHGATINVKDKLALSPLHMACKEGNKDIAEIILKSNAEINHKDKNSNTPLYYACEEGHAACASLLLKYGADVNLEGFRGNTPLHRACTQGHESIARLLLSCGADPARKNKSGHIPLYHAVLHNRLTIVKKLIDTSELDTNAYVQVLLHTACSRGHSEILETLFNQLNPALDSSNISLLHASIKAKHFNIVNILKNRGCDIKEKDENGYSILHLLCRSEDTDIQHLEHALDMDLNIEDTSKRGETVLYLACLNGNDNIVPFIIEKGVSVLSKDKYGNTALHAACSNGHFAVAKLLIQKGLSLNELNVEGITPLDVAIKNQHYGVTCLYDEWYSEARKYLRISLTSLWHICRQKKIRLLYNVEIVFSEQDSEGNSPLHIACLEEATDIIQLLIIAGAWLCVTNKSGEAPIHVACHKSYDVLKALLDTIVDKSVLLKMLSSNDKDGNSPLHIVTHELSISGLYLLLQKGANVNTVNKFDQTALHIACYKGDPEIILALLSFQANTTAQDKYGNTPLHIICMEGNLAVLKCIGHYQAFITFTNFEGRTPFHEAVKHEHYDMIRVMMLQYFNVSIDDGQEKCLRDFMHKFGTDNFVNLLIDDELHRRYSVETPLYQAAESGCHGIVELLLKRGATSGTIHSNGRESSQLTSVEADIGSQTPLHISSLNGHKDIVELLLRYEQNVNQKTNEGNTPLHLACQAGHLSIVEVLLKAGSDSNSTNNSYNTPLHVAAMFDRQDIIVHLAKWGVVDTSINENGDTALHIACAKGHTESGKILLKLNNNVLQENKDKKTAVLLTCEKGHALLAEDMLHKLWINSKLEAVQEMINPVHFGYKNHLDQCLYFACSQNHPIIIKLLLKYDADVNYILSTERENSDSDNRQHDSPLYVACQKGHVDVVDLLIDSGATLDGRTDNDYSPLHIASLQGHSEIVSLLLKNGASDSSVDAKQMTPLHLACQHGHSDVVEVLLVGGANPQTKDRDGKTPLDMCSDEGVRNTLLASIRTRHKRIGNEHQHQGAPSQKKSRYR